jgi:hypothetical protein
MVERQEFLNVNQKFQSVTQLPSFYDDAITLKSQLGSLAPLGTQEVIKQLEITEVAQLLTHTLKTADSRHLQIGDYRLKSEEQTGSPIVKLFKKESDGLYKEAVRINLSTSVAPIMRIGREDIENMRLIAKRVQLEYSPHKSPTATHQEISSSVQSTPNHQGMNSDSFAQSREDNENKRGYMGLAIKALINQYGTVQPDGSKAYNSQAYTLVETNNLNNNSLLVYRNDGKQNQPVVRIDNYQNESNPGTLKAWNIYPTEKAGFIQIAENLKKGQQLPSISDPQLNAVLGNLSPKGATQYRPQQKRNNKSKSNDIEL